MLRQFIFLRIFALTAVLISLSLATPLYAQNASSSAKKQRLEWKNDANAFEYNVQVRSVENGKIYEFVTESNFIEFSLPAGNYEWKVSAKDFLGREQSSTKWQGFEIRKMVQPEIKKVTKKVVVDVSKSSPKTEIPLESQGVEKDADVRLVNSKNGKTVQGKIEKDVAVFPKVDDGEWKLRVTNKSGLSTESEAITITDTEAIERARLEEERRIAEAKRLEEEKRLAAEKAAFEAAEKSRIAAEQAAEKERLVQEKEAEKARVAEEKAAEKERIAEEKAEEKASAKEAAASVLGQLNDLKNKPEPPAKAGKEKAHGGKDSR